jgi:hypothetical protein
VTEALGILRPDHEWPALSATIQASDNHLRITLGENGNNQREIAVPTDCAERATQVALILAVWSGELPAQDADAPSLSAAIPAPATKPAPAKAPTVFELDGAAFHSPRWGHAPGAWLGLGRTPRNGGLGIRVLGAYQSARDLVIEGGTNQVYRLLVGASATYHYQRPYLFASGDVGVVGTFTHAQGAGYEPNRSDSATNWGGLAELRAGLPLGRFRLWSSARGLRLVHAETVKVQSISPRPANTVGLSSWDLQIGLGLGYRFE